MNECGYTSTSLRLHGGKALTICRMPYGPTVRLRHRIALVKYKYLVSRCFKSHRLTYLGPTVID
jgi:hypothetical protein